MVFMEKELTILLIKDDLTNYKLVMGLENLGLVPEQYFLHASEVVLAMMGIKEEKDKDEGYALYEKMKKETLRYNLANNPKKLDEIANKIYGELESYRLLQTTKQRKKQALKQSF